MPGPTPESLAKSGSEGAEQTALFCWAALPEQQQKYPELKFMFHVPNGGGRSKSEAGKFKAQGVKPGVPDIFLPISRGGFHGLWIEMKFGLNKTSNDQNLFLNFLTIQGYAVNVCYSWQEAVKTIEAYFALMPIGNFN
jgi:hypothetical protein